MTGVQLWLPYSPLSSGELGRLSDGPEAPALEGVAGQRNAVMLGAFIKPVPIELVAADPRRGERPEAPRVRELARLRHGNAVRPSAEQSRIQGRTRSPNH